MAAWPLAPAAVLASFTRGFIVLVPGLPVSILLTPAGTGG